MAKTKNRKSPLALRTVKKESNFTVVEVGLRKPAKSVCEKCGKKIKGMSACPDCGKTFCNDCAGWTVSSNKIVCAECAIIRMKFYEQLKQNRLIYDYVPPVKMGSKPGIRREARNG